MNEQLMDFSYFAMTWFLTRDSMHGNDLKIIFFYGHLVINITKNKKLKRISKNEWCKNSIFEKEQKIKNEQKYSVIMD